MRHLVDPHPAGHREKVGAERKAGPHQKGPQGDQRPEHQQARHQSPRAATTKDGVEIRLDGPQQQHCRHRQADDANAVRRAAFSTNWLK
jgi:hypothetical protein